MGKYSDFDREERDWYPTPLKAAIPLGDFEQELLGLGVDHFVEPCAGDGRLADHVLKVLPGLNLTGMTDIEPLRDDVEQADLFKEYRTVNNSRAFITNPPWLNTPKSGNQLNKIILHLSSLSPTLALLDWNYVANLQSQECMSRCSAVLPIGRVKWIEDSKDSGKENCAWFLFVARPTPTVVKERKKLPRGVEAQYLMEEDDE